MNVTLEPLDHTNWYKVYGLSVSRRQKRFFPIRNVEWIGISRYEEKTELFAVKAGDESLGFHVIEDKGKTYYRQLDLADEEWRKA